MIKIYFPHKLYNSKFRGQLFPLLKPFLKGEGFSDKERLAIYHVSDKDFSLTNSLQSADIIILPMSWNYYKQHNQIQNTIDFVNETKRLNKKVYSFTSGDFGVKIPDLANLIVFRQSGKRSKLPANHIGIPSFISDPLKDIYQTQELSFNTYTTQPVIGFCGHTNSSKLKRIKENSKNVLHNTKSFFNLHDHAPTTLQSTTYFRSKVLTKIKASKRLEDRFIERKKYRAGATSPEERQKTTLEFYDNIKNTDYTVCVRGAGNFSVRFYETLAMGRIPVFINTDCLLPLEDTIDWKKHVVWVEENEIKDIEKIVLHFHNSHTFEELKKIQQSNRKLWEEQLTLGGFFKTYVKKNT